MLDRMEKVILQSGRPDFNHDHVVDKVELHKFIVMAVGIRERTLRSPIEAQFQISEEEISRFARFQQTESSGDGTAKAGELPLDVCCQATTPARLTTNRK